MLPNTCCRSTCLAAEAGTEISAIAPGGKGIAEAAQAAMRMQADSRLRLEDVLKLAGNPNPVARNWYLAIAQALGDKMDRADFVRTLEKFLADQSGAPEARYWALDFLAQGDQQRRENMLNNMLEDPSLDIRFEAVELALKRVDKSKSEGATKEQLATSYLSLLAAARLPSQIQKIAKKLDELGSKVDLLSHFGFVSRWHVVASFDNRNQSGFDVVYGPESEYLQRRGPVDLKVQHNGKTGKVSWQSTSTVAVDGSVDLNPIFAKEKGAICYAFTILQSDVDRACDVRLGCINANKVWVNGRLAISNEVYHADTQIDQYIGQTRLMKGENFILVKVCQNEQTDDWAQDWKFQLRLTDSSGKAIVMAQQN